MRAETGQPGGGADYNFDAQERLGSSEAARTPPGVDPAQAQKLEALRQLTGGVAHGLNNLLTVILGNMELLQFRLAGDAKALRQINNAIEGARRGVALTQRMLAFARGQNERLESVDLTETVRGLIPQLRELVGDAVDVRLSLPKDLWPVGVDRRQLEAALVNLARNAREAMPDGGRITLTACNEAVAIPSGGLGVGDFVRLAVADTGAGMNDATLARAVEPFYTTKESGFGAGLGLTMVQGFVLQLGGALRLTSQPGEGAKAELWLPRSAVPALRRQVDGAVSSASWRSRRVLVVDDDALIVMVTSDRLQALGHEVYEVQSGREALELLHSGVGIDVVLTDQVMPGMTGVQLAHAIRAQWPELPIILATGGAEPPGLDRLGLARLDKPYDLDTLAAIVVELTGEHALR